MRSLDIVQSIYESYTNVAYILNEYLNAAAYGRKIKSTGASDKEVKAAQRRRGERIYKIRNYVKKTNPKAAKAAEAQAKPYMFSDQEPYKANKPKKGYSSHDMAVQAEVDANSLNARAIKKALKNPPVKF